MLVLALLSWLVACPVPAAAQPQDGSGAAPAMPPKVVRFIELLGDNDVQTWLAEQQKHRAPAVVAEVQESAAGAFATRVSQVNARLAELYRALPRIGTELAAARQRLVAAGAERPAWLLMLVAGVVLAGLLAVRAFNRLVPRQHQEQHADAATLALRRTVILGLRLLRALAETVVFAAVSLGGFLAVPLPQLWQTVGLTYLGAAIATMAVWQLAQVLLASPDDRHGGGGLGLSPISIARPLAVHLRPRLTVVAGLVFFAVAQVDVMQLLRVDRNVAALVTYSLGLVLLGAGLELIWRRPAADNGSAGAAGPRLRWMAWTAAYSMGFIGLWLTWAAGTMRLFWLLATLLTVPLLLRIAREVVFDLFRTTGLPASSGAPSVLAAGIERAVRAVLIVGAVWFLLWTWEMGIHAPAGQAGYIDVVLRNLLKVLIVLLAFDLTWQLVRTLIDSKLARTPAAGVPGSAEAVRAAKIRTLLPVARNVLMVLFATLALMMSLSTLGVEIAPLIASAGVVGVAIGFGSQTLVKDVISGMFYLFDDAFRVGEYIVSGNYQGTVESFSLRSVRLRSSRGPIQTVPFGSLGAIQNQSRDYYIDKIEVVVPFETDLVKFRKLAKAVGAELQADPDIAGLIIEPLKMQAVTQFGDYGLHVRLKMTTLPGTQYEVRAKAFALIKRKFEENDIPFVGPSVKVVETPTAAKAAAHHAAAVKPAGSKRSGRKPA